MSIYRFISGLFILLFLLLTSCTQNKGNEVNVKGISTDQPGMNNYISAEPGETQPMDRAYNIAPPVIPHGVKEYQITKDANDCLDCHLEGDEVAEGHVATKIPESHYKNLHTGSKQNESVDGYRYNCEQCHVPQTDAKPLL